MPRARAASPECPRSSSRSPACCVRAPTSRIGARRPRCAAARRRHGIAARGARASCHARAAAAGWGGDRYLALDRDPVGAAPLIVGLIAYALGAYCMLGDRLAATAMGVAVVLVLVSRRSHPG